MADDNEERVQILFDCFSEIEQYKCKTCLTFQTSFLPSLKHHQLNGNRNEVFEKNVYKCLKCFFVTHSKYLMGRHSYFSECATRIENIRKKRFVQYRGDQSNLTLKNETQELRKTLISTCRDTNLYQQRPESVPCASKFTLKSTLMCHTEDFQSFCCNLCSATFKENSAFKAHVLSIHTKPKNSRLFKCQQCTSKFKQKGHLKTHIKIRHSRPEDIQWFKCDQCPSKFKQKGQLKTHIKLRHSKPEDIQWFKCDQCPSKFKQKGSLKTHVKLRHSKLEDIQWFECDQCPSKFKQKGSLKTHIKLRHSKPEDIQWFKCDQCPSKFKQKGSLKTHVKLRHSKSEDIQWFKCEQCLAEFKQKGSLKTHIKLRHKWVEIYSVVQM